MTYLEIVNRVLRRLRKQQVSSVTASTYSTLIGELVNEAKREVEDAHEWVELETGITLSTQATVGSYTLSNFGRRARIKRVHNETNKGEIRSAAWGWFQRQVDFTDAINSQPAYWRLIAPIDDDPVIEFYPLPDGVYSISVYGLVPQEDLESDATSVKVAPWAVYLGTFALALSERGDDRGTDIGKAQAAYQTAVADAIAIDTQNRYQGRSSDWYMHPTPTSTMGMP